MPRRKKGEGASREAIASFLHYYPQYTLADLRDGTLSLAEFRFLYAGMLDATHPEATESLEDQIARKVKAFHMAGSNNTKRGGW